MFFPSFARRDREREMAVRQRAVATLPTLMRALRKGTPNPNPNPKLPNQQPLPSLRRAFSLYDQINLIDNVPEDQLRFQGYTDEGFTVNGVAYEGSVLCVGNLITSWSPKKLSEITADREILILGCGRNIQQVHPELRRFIRSTGMKLEVLDSRNASSTYNILNEEGRIVAAALLPYGLTMGDNSINSRGSTTSETQTSRTTSIISSNGLEGSSVQLSAEKLNGKNFREWAQSVKLAVDGRGKLGYLTGDSQKPESTDAVAVQRWRSENSLITSWLINSMKPTIGKTYMFLPTAKEVWDAVRETYSDEENASQVFEIKTRLWQMKQGEREVTDYYMEMLALWQELDLSSEEEWRCSEDSALFKKRQEKERVFEFLAGLNRELDDVRGRILSRLPLPSTREVFAEVRREEARRKVMLKEVTATVPEGSALVSRGTYSGPNTRQQKGRPWCEHCRKPGHSKDNCWEVHGKPADWKPRQSPKTRGYQACSEPQPERQQVESNHSDSGSSSHDQLKKIMEMLATLQASGQPPKNTPPGTLAHRESDLSSGTTIGNAKEYEGIYYFEEAKVRDQCQSVICNSVSIPKNSDLMLWHSREAVIEEIRALETNGTWEVMKLPRGKRPVGCKWVFTIKYRADGTVERNKARLVAKGFTQIYGIDYTETFAPVAKLNTIRVLLSLAANLDWPLQQLDIKNAFLNGELEEEVYMTLPPGFSKKGEENEVCKLKKSLYGLKQSPKAWFDRFTKVIKGEGYCQGQSDHTMFFKHKNGKKTILIVYVDDIILTGDDIEEMRKLKTVLATEFEVKDLGQMRYFLGMEVARSKKGISVSQRKYTLDLLTETGMLGCKPSDTPVEAGKRTADVGKPVDREKYQKLVGKLIYLSHTRPDIAFAVSVVSQHMQSPKEAHQEAVFKILRYLKGSPGKGLLFKPSEQKEVAIFTDADWAGSIEDRRSTTGYCTFVWGNLVTWKSKKQNVVARSSAEAEFRAVAQGICEGLWLRRILEELHAELELPVKLYCDNKAAINISLNPVQHDRTKHVEVDRHFIKEKVEEGTICMTYVPTKEQIADTFTKGLSRQLFEDFIGKLDMINIYDPT
ncbi:unnamed protein product [Camellia sinensis]